MSLTRRDKNNAKLQVKAEADEMVRRYNAARAVAAQATGLDYKGVRTTTGETDYSYHEPNPLGRQTPDTGIGIFDGQTRANGKDLTPLPRYTS